MSMTATQKAELKEAILRKLASELIRNWDEIKNITGFESLSAWQKSIRGGKISLGGEDRLVMYQYDRKALDARDEEMMEFLISLNPTIATLQIIINPWNEDTHPGVYFAIILGGHDPQPEGWDNVPTGTSFNTANNTFQLTLATSSGDIEHTIALLDNLSQFVSFDQSRPKIDPDKAKEILDTTIYELLPGFQTRQEEIDDFFAQYERLRNDDPPVNFPPSDEYNLKEISFNQNNPDAYIAREEPPLGDVNHGKSLWYIYEDLTNYFDQSEFNIDDLVDQRPRYIPKSSGYLQIRNLNQAIIIRNMESDDVGLGTVDNPIWQDTGFTITMWVKFLDKVSGGTLFNLGNPLRAGNPYGFMLETFVAKKTSDTTFDIPGYYEDVTMGDPGQSTWEPHWAFSESDTERFIRLVVRDENDDIRDSHIGGSYSIAPELFMPALHRRDTREGNPDVSYTSTALEQDDHRVFNYTRVPVDLQEWYFIVATYDKDYKEDQYIEDPAYYSDPDFWKWNVIPGTDPVQYTSASGYGNKCKVEIISKTDLLRARGYRL